MPAIIITADILLQIAPRVSGAKARRQAEIIQSLAKCFADCAPAADIQTPLRAAHFLAQTAHESDGFCTTDEYASGRAYEWRKDLGNTQKGDGPRFKGRGLIQITGRKNYAAFNAWRAAAGEADPDYVKSPQMAAYFPGALLSAAWYWQANHLNKYADRDDLAAVSNVINCGRVSCRVNGGPSRAQYLARAKAVLGISSGAEADTAEGLTAALGG